MAQILRKGKTPLWGVFNMDTISKDNGYILDSYNYSVEVKDYEQLDETGKVVGYMIYDQTVNFDMSGTMLYVDESNCGQAWNCTAVQNFKFNDKRGVGNIIDIGIHNYLGGVNTTITWPSSAIMKNYSVNTSQGSAATFSASGTIYDFSASYDS